MNPKPFFPPCWFVLAAVAACCLPLGEVESAEPSATRPNILWITCEDASLLLGCYGDTHAITPNLDQLAEEGVRYTGAFAAASVCSPARSCLITGMYPTSLGTQHLRSSLIVPSHVRCFPEYLRAAGYYCTNNVKEDYNFKTPAGCWDESSRQAHWRKKPAGRPFFSVFNFTTTHQSQIRLSDEAFAERTARLAPDQRHDPAAVPLPPYYPDTPAVRRDVARFYDLMTAMDYQAGDLLAQLAEDGLADETIVFFYSDHGTGMPRHKRWLFDSGIHVPLIVRCPEKFRHLVPGTPGTTTDRLVSFVDFAPTVLSLVGLDIPEAMEGRPFLGRRAVEPRQYIFAIRDRVDEVYEVSRAVRDRRYKFIRNYMPHRPVMQHSDYSERTPTRQEFRRLAAEGKLTGPPARMVLPRKPAEELYDTQADPAELDNLVDSPEHQTILQRMRAEHRRWTLATRDTGLLQESEMYLRVPGLAPYDLTRRDDFPLERIVETADLVGRGTSALPELTEKLTDPDRAVRYWAATGLAALGANAQPADDALQATLEDPSPSVRLAAAEALCHIDRPDRALPVLTAGLRHEEGWVRLHAAMTLVAVGDQAEGVVSEIEAVLKKKDTHRAGNYVRWGLMHAIESLESEN